MTEFTNGMLKALKQLNANGSLIRTFVYTVGHILIAVTCVMTITGSTFYQALTDAFIEPILNSVWFFALDRFWASRVANHQHNNSQANYERIEPIIDPENIELPQQPDLSL